MLDQNFGGAYRICQEIQKEVRLLHTIWQRQQLQENINRDWDPAFSHEKPARDTNSRRSFSSLPTGGLIAEVPPAIGLADNKRSINTG